MHKTLRDLITEMGRELVCRVNDGEPLGIIEQHLVQKLASVDSIKLVISAYNRRNTEDKNLFQNVNELGKYVATMNLLDGHVNYARGSRVYGMSISLTNIDLFEHFSFVFDNSESMAFTIENGKITGFPLSRDRGRGRFVVGLGRIFTLSASSYQELEDTSLRSLGSTTVSLVQVIRGRMDIFITKTKMWTIWWALGLSHYGCLFVEDLVRNESIHKNYLGYLSDPGRTIYIACYRNCYIRREFKHLLTDITELAGEGRGKNHAFVQESR